MTTIRDIAKLANVSVATVSRIINNSGKVSKDTREKLNQKWRSICLATCWIYMFSFFWCRF